MTNKTIRLQSDNTGTSVINDDVEARKIIGSGSANTWQQGHDWVVEVPTVEGGTGINVVKSGNTYTASLAQQTALTTPIGTITFTEPGTLDTLIQDITLLSPYGFKTQDEGRSVLKVIANLQTRVNELEARLQTAGLL